MQSVHVIPAPWGEFKSQLQSIREQVFIIEQQVPKALEWDGADEGSTHFLALTSAGHYIGCARLLPNGQIGRMAVLGNYRRSGIGALLLEAAVAEAKKLGMQRIFLHAQSYAEQFYHKGGFVAFGERFMEAGIEHIAMEMILPVPFEPVADPAIVAAKAQHSSTTRNPTTTPGPKPLPRTFDGLVEARQRLVETIGSARRQLYIMSPLLDHLLFDETEVIDTVSALARSAARVQVHIIIMHSKLMVERGHGLLDLARRLDEKILIRKFDEPITAETSTFVCADTDAYWVLPDYEQYKGVNDLTNPVNARRMRETFEQTWARSRTDPDLRQLRL